MGIARRVVERLPRPYRQGLKRWRYARWAASARGIPGEPELDELASWVRPGDWAIDVGANLGAYTIRLAEAVGPGGRVFAFEPVPETFDYLCYSVQRLGLQNVTLLNVAASAESGALRMAMPRDGERGANFYEAAVAADGELSVYGLAIDRLAIDRRVALVKIDAEGHERSVVEGMERLIRRDHPTLIYEANEPCTRVLEEMGYRLRHAPGSCNLVAEFPRDGAEQTAAGGANHGR